MNWVLEDKVKNFQFEEDPFSKDPRGIKKIYHEVLILMILLQTKPRVKDENINYYDFYYTIIENRGDKETVNNKNEDNKNDYFFNEDFIIPNHNISSKPLETMLK